MTRPCYDQCSMWNRTFLNDTKVELFVQCVVLVFWESWYVYWSRKKLTRREVSHILSMICTFGRTWQLCIWRTSSSDPLEPNFRNTEINNFPRVVSLRWTCFIYNVVFVRRVVWEKNMVGLADCGIYNMALEKVLHCNFRNIFCCW